MLARMPRFAFLSLLPLLAASVPALADDVIDKVLIKGLDKGDDAAMIENIEVSLSLYAAIGKPQGAARMDYLLSQAEAQTRDALEPFGYYTPSITVDTPHFPILVLFYFVLKDDMNWLMLVLILSALGWSYDARLIRSIAMSLRTRPFTTQSVYSGMSMRKILVEEHLPYVMPIVFATTMNNMIWSIGMEITLSVLGFTDVDTPTMGQIIYWANSHSALISGIWWWVAAPVIAISPASGCTT